jgi:MFS family permease
MHEEPASPDRARLGLYVATFLLMLGQGVVIPVLPAIVEATPGDTATAAVGLAVAAFGLARLLSSLPAGQLAGIIGPRLLIVAGPIAMAVSLFGLAFATTLEWIVGWRLLAGVSSAAFLTGSLIYLGNAVPQAGRGKAYASFYMAFSAGFGAGPAIGGLLAEVNGVGLPLFVVAGTSLVSAGVASVVLPRERIVPASDSSDGRPGWAPWSDARFLAIGLLSLLVYATRNGTQQTVVPTAAVDLGMPLFVIGLGFSVAAVVNAAGAPLVGYLLDKFDRRLLMVGSVAALGVTILGWTLDGWLPASYLVTMAAYGVVSILVDSSVVTNASDVAPEEARARAIGYFRVFSDGGYVLGPLVFAWLADAGSPSAAIATNAALLVVASLVGIAVMRRSPRRGQDRRLS